MTHEDEVLIWLYRKCLSLLIFKKMEILKATNLTKSFGQLQVLKGVNLSIEENELLSIVGTSGAGKSTLLHILGTLDQPDLGGLVIGGKKVDALKGKDLANFRNQEIGFVFQFHNLLPEFSAIENICMPGYLSQIDRTTVEHRAMELMSILRVDQRASHKPSELSGGEQQRVAVARALINNPSIVFADEPSGNLDSKNAKALHELFFELRDKFNQTFVIVTHNEELADMADRKVEMKDGAVI
jgi:lipoprotein-releasing system ATP-binding protein